MVFAETLEGKENFASRQRVSLGRCLEKYNTSGEREREYPLKVKWKRQLFQLAALTHWRELDTLSYCRLQEYLQSIPIICTHY